MALPDPVTVAASSPTPELVFVKTKFDGYGSEYIDNAGLGFKVIINHTQVKGGGTRHYVQVTQEKSYADPSTGLTRKAVGSASFSLSRPPGGFTGAEISALGKLLTDFRDDTEVTMAKLILLQS